MKYALLAILLTACGPSWSDVRTLPGGVYQDVRTGECWTADMAPVRCPEESHE
jgi:hypothetical protein